MIVGSEIFDRDRVTLPGMANATLTISVNQSLDGKLTVNAPKHPQVKIDAPRFELTPADIAGVYPAPGSEEAADEFLPHIALRRRTLAWERPGPAGAKSWLALILVSEPELREGQNLDEALPSVITPTTAGAIAAQDPLGGAAIAATGVAASTPVSVVYLKNSLWLSIRPDIADIGLLTHIRRTTSQFGQLLTMNEDVAVVIGNRLPFAGGPGDEPALHTAFLVSLEGRNDLYGAANTRTPTAKVALPVLHHWTFKPSKGGDFESVIRAIRYRPNGGVLRFGNLPAAPSQGVPAPLSGGFDALLNTNGFFRDPLPHTLEGELSWRSPLRPFTPPARSQGFAIRPAPEEFVNAPPGTPHDYSHATAFEIGRLLAIANAGILEDLRNIRGRMETIKPPVAINKLPTILQKPDWVSNPAWQQYIDQPWQSGANQMIKNEQIFLNAGVADVGGIQVGQWGGIVLNDLNQMPIANAPPVVMIDLNTVNTGQLGKVFAEVEIAGMS